MTPRARTSESEWRTWAPLLGIALILVTGVALGGGGVRYAMANLVVQLTALAVLATRRQSFAEFWRSAPVLLKALVGLSLLIPVAQLIPLPPDLWRSLPGRELVAQSFDLVGKGGWAPASVDPIRTFVALTGLIVPIAVLSAGWTLDRDRLPWLGWLVVLLGLLNLLIGIPTVITAGNAGALYESYGSSGVLNGTFANRNSTGILLVASLGFAALLPWPRKGWDVLGARIGICLLLLVAIILTRSRTALVLAIVPLALAGLKAFVWSIRPGGVDERIRRRLPTIALAAIALVVGSAAAVVAFSPGRVGDTIERFEAVDDGRLYIWEDASHAVSRYWPIGSGMGTFDEVFQIDESLENATQRRAGRAHNDYLEIAIEAGFAGIAVVFLWLVCIGWLAWQARHSRLRWAAWSAASALLVIALQSITDYPLRNQGILAVAGLALLLLARIALTPREPEA